MSNREEYSQLQYTEGSASIGSIDVRLGGVYQIRRIDEGWISRIEGNVGRKSRLFLVRKWEGVQHSVQLRNWCG